MKQPYQFITCTIIGVSLILASAVTIAQSEITNSGSNVLEFNVIKGVKINVLMKQDFKQRLDDLEQKLAKLRITRKEFVVDQQALERQAEQNEEISTAYEQLVTSVTNLLNECNTQKERISQDSNLRDFSDKNVTARMKLVVECFEIISRQQEEVRSIQKYREELQKNLQYMKDRSAINTLKAELIDLEIKSLEATIMTIKSLKNQYKEKNEDQ